MEDKHIKGIRKYLTENLDRDCLDRLLSLALIVHEFIYSTNRSQRLEIQANKDMVVFVSKLTNKVKKLYLHKDNDVILVSEMKNSEEVFKYFAINDLDIKQAVNSLLTR